MSRPPVLVTGGTGFLGAHLLPRLVTAGHAVHVLARESSSRAHLDGLPLTWHTGDVCDAASVDESVAAVGAGAWVVHAAALISYRAKDADRSNEVNVAGTRRVLEACRTHGIGRMCFVSSVVAVGQAPDASSVVDEEHAFDGARLGCVYVTSKRAAEETVLSGAAELDVVVVNPGAIFGPAPRPSNTTRFLKSVVESVLSVPAPPGSLSVVGVGDVADGVLLALERGRRGRRYLLCESNWTHAELFAYVREACGRRPRRQRLPTWLWRAVVGVATVVDRVRPFEVAAPQALRLLGEHYRFDSARARAELGWNPRPFAEVLADTIAWMRAEGLLAP